jgi:hypothetical protein
MDVNDASTTLLSLGVQNQERIQVEFEENGSTTKSSSAAKKTTTTTTTTRTKSKRAAAKAATEAMPSIIQAQEDMMKEQQSSSSPRKRPRTTTTKAVAPRKKPPPPPQIPAGQGRRLADGAAVSSPSSSNRRRRPTPRSTAILSSKSKSSDMSEALMGALNNKGKMGQVLRKGMTNAVQASYETTRAFSRLAAIQGQTYTVIVVDDNSNNTDNIGVTLSISYQGTVDKQKVQEQVDCIPQDVLEAVIRGIHASNQEALRPENLALLSPRVWWSLMHTFPDTTDIPTAYAQLLPDITDWSFLRRRQQQLSKKALENLRQEQEENGETENMEQASEAIAAVEHAMEHLQDYESTERKAKQAQAALARLQQASNTTTSTTATEWQLVTPSEPDRDELQDCIQVSSSQTTTDIPSLITRLMKECRIHNWRELANVTDVPALAQRLQISTTETVQQWVDKAQDESVGEIMVEICDDQVAVVEVLTEKARTGTPKDLAAWRCLPEMLHEQVKGSLEEQNTNTVTVAQLEVWCQRAYRLLQDYEWLNWYATPVE